MPVCFICFFILFIAMKIEEKTQPPTPRPQKIKWNRFSSRFFFLTVREPKYFFQDKANYVRVYMYLGYLGPSVCDPRHDKTNNMALRPAKTQISLSIRPVWSESLLSAWRSIRSLATHWAHSEDSDQTGRMPRLIWVFAGRTLILLVLSCRGSYVHIKTFLISAI